MFVNSFLLKTETFSPNMKIAQGTTEGSTETSDSELAEVPKWVMSFPRLMQALPTGIPLSFSGKRNERVAW